MNKMYLKCYTVVLDDIVFAAGDGVLFPLSVHAPSLVDSHSVDSHSVDSHSLIGLRHFHLFDFEVVVWVHVVVCRTVGDSFLVDFGHPVLPCPPH